MTDHLMTTKPMEHIYVLLHDRYPVSIELLDATRHQLADIHFYFNSDQNLTAKKLCGDPFWNLFSLGEKKTIGSCLSHLVKHGELPLFKVSKPGKYPNKYRLQPCTPQLFSKAAQAVFACTLTTHVNQ